MNRFSRQGNLAPHEKLVEETVLLVGAGAVGRPLALSLAAMGVKNLAVCDFDDVEEINMATQGYGKDDLNEKKVKALINRMMESDLEGDAKFTGVLDPFSVDIAREISPTIIFSCVDSMEVRHQIFEYFQTSDARLFIDGRMQGEDARLFTIENTDEDHEFYLQHWFPDHEADDSPCARRSNIYCASVLANCMITQMAKHLRKFPFKQRGVQIQLGIMDFQEIS